MRRRLSIGEQRMIDFHKRVLFLGYGAVAQCTLPIFVKHFRVPLEQHYGPGFRGPRGAR